MTAGAGQPRDYAGVAVVAPVTVPYVRQSDKSASWFIGRALAMLLKASGLAKAEIDAFAVSSFTLTPDSSVGLVEHFGLAPRFLEWLPTGGASGVMALRRAARAVQAGDANVVACIAGDTASPTSFQGLLENFSSFSTDAVLPYGALGPNGVFAMIMRQYMHAHGIDRAAFAPLCVAMRAHAAAHPLALLRKPITVEDYINARPIAEPVHLLDCVMPCAGADGFLVMTTDRARALGLPWAEIAGSIERHNAFADADVIDRGGWMMDRDSLYAQAGMGPKDMDFLQTYDDYPVICCVQMEDLGFCAKGEAADFIARTDLSAAGGGLPHNTSGGQLGMGQPGAAGGYLGLVEALRQLTGTALGAVVPDAHQGLVAGYGMVNYDRGLCSAAAILRKGGA